MIHPAKGVWDDRSGQWQPDRCRVAQEQLQLAARNNCVEVATNLPRIVAVRDSKDREGARLAFQSEAWAAFVGGVKAEKIG